MCVCFWPQINLEKNNFCKKSFRKNKSYVDLLHDTYSLCLCLCCDSNRIKHNRIKKHNHRKGVKKPDHVLACIHFQ